MRLNQSETTRKSPMTGSTRVRVMYRISLVLAAVFLWLPSAGRADSNQHILTCGYHATIGEAIRKLNPGETLFVRGTCNENLEIGAEVERITLDGRGIATINGDSSTNTVTVTGRDITIRGFIVTGGVHAIAVQDGASAEIDGNTIQNAGKYGIFVLRNSTARITNNRIQNNPSGGINIGHTSSALIGFTGPAGNRVSAPNTIQNNTGPGIQVLRGSSSQIFSNTIQNNGSHGVLVDRSAQVEIAACTITGNVGDGVRGMRGAGIDFGIDSTAATPTFDDDTNTGINGGFGVRCMIAGFVDGRLGGLTGTLGGKSFSESCVDSVQP